MKNSVLRQNLVSVAGRRAASAALAFALGIVTVVGPSSAQGQTWKESVLYSFTGADGKPEGGLIVDARGNLYGTTSQGGASSDGTVPGE